MNTVESFKAVLILWISSLFEMLQISKESVVVIFMCASASSRNVLFTMVFTVPDASLNAANIGLNCTPVVSSNLILSSTIGG